MITYSDADEALVRWLLGELALAARRREERATRLGDGLASSLATLERSQVESFSWRLLRASP